jgi:hypothetical protein
VVNQSRRRLSHADCRWRPTLAPSGGPVDRSRPVNGRYCHRQSCSGRRGHRSHTALVSCGSRASRRKMSCDARWRRCERADPRSWPRGTCCAGPAGRARSPHFPPHRTRWWCGPRPGSLRP